MSRATAATTQSTWHPDACASPSSTSQRDDGSCTDGQHANLSFGAFSRSAQATPAPGGGKCQVAGDRISNCHQPDSCPANYTASLLSSEVKVWS